MTCLPNGLSILLQKNLKELLELNTSKLENDNIFHADDQIKVSRAPGMRCSHEITLIVDLFNRIDVIKSFGRIFSWGGEVKRR